MRDLVQSLEKSNIELRDINGIAYLKGKETIITSPRHVIQDLDSLPFPARHLLPMNEYYEAANTDVTIAEFTNSWTTMITSRGCPYKCIFCSIHIVMGRKWRPRSPENVVNEIEQLVYKFNIKQIGFEDDNMTLNRDRMATICDLIIERGLDIEWIARNGVRADTLDEIVLKKIKKSGGKTLWLAPESGVQNVVDEIIKKQLDLKKVEEVVKLSKKVGLTVGCYFVIGLPGETKEDIINTINYARKLRRLGADHFDFNIATPYYGTELYELAKVKGYLREFSNEYLSTLEPHIETPEFTIDEIRDLRKKAKRAILPPLISYENLLRVLNNPKEIMNYILKRVRS